jgi:hypothetical protein
MDNKFKLNTSCETKSYASIAITKSLTLRNKDMSWMIRCHCYQFLIDSTWIDQKLVAMTSKKGDVTSWSLGQVALPNCSFLSDDPISQEWHAFTMTCTDLPQIHLRFFPSFIGR